MERWATFDCYGTLIDWNGGIRPELVRLFPDEDADRLLTRYHDEEPKVQAEDPSRSYREVLTLALERLGLRVPEGERSVLAESLPRWPPFPEVPAALAEARVRGWKLAILSNSDRDLIEASEAQFGVPFELEIVSEEIGSYKPAHGHWRAFERRSGGRPTCTSPRASSTTSRRQESSESPASGSTARAKSRGRGRRASCPT